MPWPAQLGRALSKTFLLVSRVKEGRPMLSARVLRASYKGDCLAAPSPLASLVTPALLLLEIITMSART